MLFFSYLRAFAPKAQSAFVRRAYARELTAEVSYTFPLAMLAPGVVGIIATLLFDVGSFGLATIVAAPMFANLTSTVWAKLGHGRAKAKVFAVIQTALLLIVVGIALLPVRPSSAVALVALYVLARCLVSGLLTIRTVIWRANYPRHSRSRITGRLMIINTLMIATVPIIAAGLFDKYQQTNPWLFRAVYLGAACVGVVGIYAYLGLRVRRERVLIREEKTRRYDQNTGQRISPLQVLRTD